MVQALAGMGRRGAGGHGSLLALESSMGGRGGASASEKERHQGVWKLGGDTSTSRSGNERHLGGVGARW